MDYHKWILDPEAMLDRMEEELSGLTYDRNTGVFKQTGEALLNQKGIKAIRTMLRSISGTNTLLSRIFDRADLSHQGFCITTEILGEMILNKDEWGYKTEKQGFIISIIANYVDFALRRAYQGEEKEFAKNTMVTRRNVNEQPRNPNEPIYQETPVEPPRFQ